MLNLLVLLADSSPLNPLDNSAIPDGQASHLSGFGMREILFVIGVAAVLGLLLFLMVYLTHKGRRHNHSSQRLSKVITKATKKPSTTGDTERVKVRRRRRRRAETLPRNPTLGETGGLPPIRPEEPPPEVAQS